MTIYYDSSIVKKDKDGNVRLATTLEKGETLIDGSTYRDEEVRLRSVNGSSKFAQSSMTEHNNPENPAPGLTVDETVTNTVRVGDDTSATGEQGEETPSLLAATVTEDGNSTAIVPTEGNDAPLSAAESGMVRDEKTSSSDERPKDSDDKETWYNYAVSKGFDGEYETTTKKSFIEQYG